MYIHMSVAVQIYLHIKYTYIYVHMMYIKTFLLGNDDETTGLELLHRKTVSEAFWNGEIENEFRIRSWTKKPFSSKDSRECYMNDIDNIR